MGRSTIGGGGHAVAEVATSFPARCLGAIRTRKKFWEISKEEAEESSKTLRNSWVFEEKISFSDV